MMEIMETMETMEVMEIAEEAVRHHLQVHRQATAAPSAQPAMAANANGRPIIPETALDHVDISGLAPKCWPKESDAG